MFTEMPPTPYQDRHAELKLEFLELDAKIAETTRAFHVDGVSISINTRSEMMAKAKLLTLELHRMNILGREEKAKAIVFKSKTFLASLIRKLEEKGLGQIIKDAQQESIDALRDAGMLNIYKDKNY